MLWQEYVLLGFFDAAFGLGGWSFDVQHHYDTAGRILHLGNGERHTPADSPTGHLIISTVAGGGTKGLGDDGPAVLARLDDPTDTGGAGSFLGRYAYLSRGVAIAPSGMIYIADGSSMPAFNSRIRRVDLDGTITTIAGGGKLETVNGRATEMKLHSPGALALALDGGIYLLESDYHRVRRLSPDGQLTVVAGNNTAARKKPGYSGDGGPAIKAELNFPSGLAVAPDGTLYIADQGNHCIRRVSPDGIITTIAGQGGKDQKGKDQKGNSGDDGQSKRGSSCPLSRSRRTEVCTFPTWATT